MDTTDGYDEDGPGLPKFEPPRRPGQKVIGTLGHVPSGRGSRVAVLAGAALALSATLSSPGPRLDTNLYPGGNEPQPPDFFSSRNERRRARKRKRKVKL